MRTKTLLLTAALAAAGVATSMAQTVYSVNAVGYVNITLKPGFNLIANPLNGSNNGLQTILPAGPNDSVVLRWDNGSQSFNPLATATYFGAPDNVWLDNNFDPTTNSISPGEGFFLLNQTGIDQGVTFVGEVPQSPPALVNTIKPNFGFYSHIVPQDITLPAAGFPAVGDMVYQEFNATTQAYDPAKTSTYFGAPDNVWLDNNFATLDPKPGIAAGFLLFNPAGNQSWSRTFTVSP